MKILTAQQMKELDAYTIQESSISSIDLMERAARGIFEEILLRWDNSVPVVVFAGPGNNGGDALAVARMLSQQNYHVTVYLFNVKGKLSDDCAVNRERLKACDNVVFHEVIDQFEPPALGKDSLVVDGLFGTGLNKALTGGFAVLVKFINLSGVQVLSIDMPSGLMCEDNSCNVRGHIIRATLTLTFQLPKLALLLADNAPFVGELKILDIALSTEGINRMDSDMSVMTISEVQGILKKRPIFGHKGTFGHALLVAGKYGMAGAAVLAARACLKSGVGKVSVHTPRRNNDILQMSLPEAILSHDADERMFTQAISTEPYSAMGIGPGIGTEHKTALAFMEQVKCTRIPLVIDADGINILSDHRGWLQQIPHNTIFTPHPLEFRRLGINCSDSYSTLAEARELALIHHFYIVLKGHFTAICTPEGKVYFNPTGNSGMATAGSGDVLTGIITALLAQKYSELDACRLGVYIHGLAGDLAARDLGETSVMASDIINYLPEAFCHLE